jgi:hypothetical protein
VIKSKNKMSTASNNNTELKFEKFLDNLVSELNDSYQSNPNKGVVNKMEKRLYS